MVTIDEVTNIKSPDIISSETPPLPRTNPVLTIHDTQTNGCTSCGHHNHMIPCHNKSTYPTTSLTPILVPLMGSQPCQACGATSHYSFQCPILRVEQDLTSSIFVYKINFSTLGCPHKNHMQSKLFPL